MLDDPNSLLRDDISKQKTLNTNTLFISTVPPPPAGLFGGGTGILRFSSASRRLLTDASAIAAQITTILWIKKGEATRTFATSARGHPQVHDAKASVPEQHVARF